MSESYAPMCPSRHIPICGFYDFETGACNADLAPVLADLCYLIEEDLDDEEN